MTGTKNVLIDAFTKQAPKKFLRKQEIPTSERTADPVEIKSLQIAHDHDQNCDPYNRTGQFCIVEIKDSE